MHSRNNLIVERCDTKTGNCFDNWNLGKSKWTMVNHFKLQSENLLKLKKKTIS